MRIFGKLLQAFRISRLLACNSIPQLNYTSSACASFPQNPLQNNLIVPNSTKSRQFGTESDNSKLISRRFGRSSRRHHDKIKSNKRSTIESGSSHYKTDIVPVAVINHNINNVSTFKILLIPVNLFDGGNEPLEQIWAALSLVKDNPIHIEALTESSLNPKVIINSPNSQESIDISTNYEHINETTFKLNGCFGTQIRKSKCKRNHIPDPQFLRDIQKPEELTLWPNSEQHNGTISLYDGFDKALAEQELNLLYTSGSYKMEGQISGYNFSEYVSTGPHPSTESEWNFERQNDSDNFYDFPEGNGNSARIFEERDSVSLREGLQTLTSCPEAITTAQKEHDTHHFSASTQTLQPEASKVTYRSITEFKLPELNEYLRSVHKRSSRSEFQADAGRMAYSTKSAAETKKRSPHIVCVREGDKGCVSPGLADNPKYEPTVSSKAFPDDDASLSGTLVIKKCGIRELMSCQAYAKAVAEAQKKRAELKTKDKKPKDDCKPCSPSRERTSKIASSPSKEQASIQGSTELTQTKKQMKTVKEERPICGETKENNEYRAKGTFPEECFVRPKSFACRKLPNTKEKKFDKDPCETKKEATSPTTAKDSSKIDKAKDYNKKADPFKSQKKPDPPKSTGSIKGKDAGKKADNKPDSGKSDKKPDPCKSLKDNKGGDGSKKADKAKDSIKSEKKADPCKSSKDGKGGDASKKADKAKDSIKSEKKADPCKSPKDGKGGDDSKKADKAKDSKSEKKGDPCKSLRADKGKDPCKRFAKKKDSDKSEKKSAKDDKKDPCKKDDKSKNSGKPEKKADPSKSAKADKKDPCKKDSSKSEKKADPYKPAKADKKDPCKKDSSKSEKKADPCKPAKTDKKDICKKDDKSKGPPKKSSESRKPEKCSSSKKQSKAPSRKCAVPKSGSVSKSSEKPKSSDENKPKECKSESKSQKSEKQTKSKSGSEKKTVPGCPSMVNANKSTKPNCPAGNKKSGSGQKGSGGSGLCPPKKSFSTTSVPLLNGLLTRSFGKKVFTDFSKKCSLNCWVTTQFFSSKNNNGNQKGSGKCIGPKTPKKRFTIKREKRECFGEDGGDSCAKKDLCDPKLAEKKDARCPKTKACKQIVKSTESPTDACKDFKKENKILPSKDKKSSTPSKIHSFNVAPSTRTFCTKPTEPSKDGNKCDEGVNIKKEEKEPTNQVIKIVDACKIETLQTCVPRFSDYDVLIRTHSVAISGSDIHVYETGGKTAPGITIGHDASGIVEKAGKCVQNLKPGDRVAIESALSCGICNFCKSGTYNICSQLMHNGFFAKFQVHPADLCHKLPDVVSLEEGSLVQTLATGCHACNQARINPTANVLIIGSSPTAIAAALCARAIGANRVCFLCSEDSSLELIRNNFKFEYIIYDDSMPINSVVESIYCYLRDWPDVIINCAVSNITLNIGVMTLAPNGVCVMAECESECASFNAMEVIMKNLKLISSFRSTNMFPTALLLMESGQAPMHELIAEIYEWKNIDSAFVCALHHSNISNKKVIVTCES